MQATFYNFSKKGNSTKRPTGAGTVFDIKLKTPTSIENPVVTISHPATENLYTYVYIPKVKRYYHVVGYNSINANVTEYSLQEDYLSTYKPEILDMTTYVTRSASDPDLSVHDDTWINNGVVHNSVQTISAFTGNETGCIVLGVVNGSPTQSGMGGISYIAFDIDEFRKLVTGLFNTSSYESSMTDDVKYYFNPFQYIVSCYYAPMTPANFAGAESRLLNVGFGWWTYAATNLPYLLLGRGRTFSFDFVPGGTFANWTNRSSEWTNMEMYVPGIGFFSLDSSYYGISMRGELTVDYATGSCTLVVGVKDGDNIKTVLSKTGQFGKSIQLSQLSVDKLQYMEDNYNYQYGSAGTIFSGLGNIVGGALRGDVGSALGGVGQIFRGGHEEQLNNTRFVKTISSPALSLAGHNDDSRFLSKNTSVKIFTHYYEPYHLPTNYVGGAKYQSVKLSTLSGFTQVLNGSVDISGTSNEKQAIKNLLEGGFYIE